MVCLTQVLQSLQSGKSWIQDQGRQFFLLDYAAVCRILCDHVHGQNGPLHHLFLHAGVERPHCGYQGRTSINFTASNGESAGIIARRISDTSAQAAFDMFLLIASDALDGMVRYRPFFPCLSIAILFSTESMALGTSCCFPRFPPKVFTFACNFWLDWVSRRIRCFSPRSFCLRSWIVCPALVQCFLEFVSAVSPLAKLSPAANHLWLNLDTAVGILGGWHLLGNRPGALGASMTKKKKAKEQHAQAQAASVALQSPGAHPVPAMAWSGASLHCCSLLPCSLLMAFLGRQVPLQSQQTDFESSARHRYLHSEGPEELEEVSMNHPRPANQCSPAPPGLF